MKRAYKSFSQRVSVIFLTLLKTDNTCIINSVFRLGHIQYYIILNNVNDTDDISVYIALLNGLNINTKM